MEESQIYRSLGTLVRRQREACSLSQGGLGQLVGLSRASIANIETGRQRVLLHHLYGLAVALRVDVRALVPRMTPDGEVSPGPQIKATETLSESEQAEVTMIVGSIDLLKPEEQ